MTPQTGRTPGTTVPTVMHVGGLNWASEQASWTGAGPASGGRWWRSTRSRRPPRSPSTRPDLGRRLRRWVQECGYHCAGQSVPSQICDPLAEPDPPGAHGCERDIARGPEARAHPRGHEGRYCWSFATRNDGSRRPWRHVDGGDGRRHAQPVPGRGDVLDPDLVVVAGRRRRAGLGPPAPFGLRDDVWLLLLSLPVIGYSAWIFFDGADRALRARTLDMMVLVAVAVGAGWLYSLAVTLTGGGDMFYEAATCWPRSCCWATGSRCVPGVGPTTRSARCWISRRRGRPCTGRPSRGGADRRGGRGGHVAGAARGEDRR